MAGLTVEDIAKLSDKEAKFALLKLYDPTINDNQAAKLCDYAPKSGTQVKNRVAGKIGGILAERGLTLDSVVKTLDEGLKAMKSRHIFINEFNDKGKQTGARVELKEVGPDYGARIATAKTIIMLHKLGEQEKTPDEDPGQIVAPEMSDAEAEGLTGRGGPTEVVEADFEVSDAANG